MPKNVTVQKIIAILLHRIKFIILTTVVCTLLFFAFSKLFISPQYSTSAMIYVQNYNNSAEGSNKEDQKIYSSDISGSSSLASICVTLFENSDEITALYNGCAVSMAVDDGTFFITISVSGDDAQKCANVANQIVEKSIEVFDSYFVYGQIGEIREAQTPENPYSPNNVKNAMIGFAVGLALSCLISILVELIDTTIKSDDDIQEMYDLPVFAEIPDFEG